MLWIIFVLWILFVVAIGVIERKTESDVCIFALILSTIAMFYVPFML